MGYTKNEKNFLKIVKTMAHAHALGNIRSRKDFNF